MTLSSVALLGLSPSSFRLVSESEMTHDGSPSFGHHRDGSHCTCHLICQEDPEIEADERDRLLAAGCWLAR